jgi:hypothetical protein
MRVEKLVVNPSIKEKALVRWHSSASFVGVV